MTSFGSFATGVGLTVIVNVSGIPIQEIPPLINIGVTFTLAIKGEEPLFCALNAAILFIPAEFNPMAATVFVQLYCVAVPVKLIAGVSAALQI